MKRVYYNKLVRDRIKDKIEAVGEACEIRTIADDQEYQQELLKKIKEEASELAAAPTRDQFLAEYCDLMVVLDALTAKLEISEADIRVAMSENVAKKGLYRERHFLHWSEDKNYQPNESAQGIQ